MTVKLLVESPGKFRNMILKLVTKTYMKFVMLRLLFTSLIFSHKRKNFFFLNIDFEKSTNSFEIKNRLPEFVRFFNHFSESLLYKINVLDIFNMVDFCFIAEYWNSHPIKLFFGNVRVILKALWNTEAVWRKASLFDWVFFQMQETVCQTKFGYLGDLTIKGE